MIQDHTKFKCDECDGVGKCTLYPTEENQFNVTYNCSKCQGKGYLDWIENIVGVKRELRYGVHYIDTVLHISKSKEMVKGCTFKVLKNRRSKIDGNNNFKYSFGEKIPSGSDT